MASILYKDESYSIVGALFDVHNELGGGLLEVVYKDALEYEFMLRGIPFQREKEYAITYKGKKLPHNFYADFIVFDKIILEIKAITAINDANIAQCINYLKISNNKLAILANFESDKLIHQRIVL